MDMAFPDLDVSLLFVNVIVGEKFFSSQRSMFMILFNNEMPVKLHLQSYKNVSF